MGNADGAYYILHYSTDKEVTMTDFPIKTKVYLHGDDDSFREQATELGFTEYQTKNFERTGYEVTFDVLVDENGIAFATHVNGVALVKPVEI